MRIEVLERITEEYTDKRNKYLNKTWFRRKFTIERVIYRPKANHKYYIETLKHDANFTKSFTEWLAKYFKKEDITREQIEELIFMINMHKYRLKDRYSFLELSLGSIVFSIAVLGGVKIFIIVLTISSMLIISERMFLKDKETIMDELTCILTHFLHEEA